MGFVIIKQLIKKLFTRTSSKKTPKKPLAATTDEALHKAIISRQQHGISRSMINENALTVLYRLKKAKFASYLVGGSVRDLLLGKIPKDFDVATNARPEQIKRLFRNCRLIGRRFRLAHIYFGRDFIEVATFRSGQHEPEHKHAKGMILHDNVYGTEEEDVWRRDFTINALYYNIADFSVIDYCGGMADLHNQLIRMIGDPSQRYHEDPVRLLRAIRFAAKLQFNIEASTEKPLAELGELLTHVSPARLFEEVLKLFFCGHSLIAYQLLRHYHLFGYLFAQTDNCLRENAVGTTPLLTIALENTDQRIKENKSVNPAFLLTAFLWFPWRKQIEKMQKKGYKGGMAYELALNKILSKQTQQLAVPKRLSKMIREICQLQAWLEKPRKKYVFELLKHPRFRAAYDFLILRTQSGEKLQHLVAWWSDFQDSDNDARNKMAEALAQSPLAKTAEALASASDHS